MHIVKLVNLNTTGVVVLHELFLCPKWAGGRINNETLYQGGYPY